MRVRVTTCVYQRCFLVNVDLGRRRKYNKAEYHKTGQKPVLMFANFQIILNNKTSVNKAFVHGGCDHSTKAKTGISRPWRN